MTVPRTNVNKDFLWRQQICSFANLLIYSAKGLNKLNISATLLTSHLQKKTCLSNCGLCSSLINSGPTI